MVENIDYLDDIQDTDPAQNTSYVAVSDIKKEEIIIKQEVITSEVLEQSFGDGKFLIKEEIEGSDMLQVLAIKLEEPEESFLSEQMMIKQEIKSEDYQSFN